MRSIREKLSGLAFLDPAIAPLVGSIDEVLAAVPGKGKINGTALAALRGVVSLLTEPAQMRSHGQLILEGNAKGLLGASPPDPLETQIERVPAQTIVAQDFESAPVRPRESARGPRVSTFW